MIDNSVKQTIHDGEYTADVWVMSSRLANRIMWAEQDAHDGGSQYHLAKAYYMPFGEDNCRRIGLWW